MVEYRLYAFDPVGVVHLPHEFEARDDAEAIALADARCIDGRLMELWESSRKVHCWGFPECPSACQ